MSFVDNFINLLPFRKKEQKVEYFFALNIGLDRLTAALWTIEGKQLKILDTASETYTANEEITNITDKLLDQVLGLKEVEIEKILFGVPNSWLSDDNLKDEYLKLLRGLVKELELSPMAYVATSHAVVHFLEKQEGVPTTAILVGFEQEHMAVTVVRAGKLDGVKIIKRGDNSGSDIEKVLLTFADVETLPSKILIYGSKASGLKSQLLSFPWMSKLSFLHFPKIDILGEDLEIRSVCLAGASEIHGDVLYTDYPIKKGETKSSVITPPSDSSDEVLEEETPKAKTEGDLGFVVGDVSEKVSSSNMEKTPLEDDDKLEKEAEASLLPVDRNVEVEIEDFEKQDAPTFENKINKRFDIKRFVTKSSNLVVVAGIVGVLLLFLGALLFLVKAEVKIFVEPRILEKDAQVIADPNQKQINEEAKIIPGQIVETEVSGSGNSTATGKKQVGDPAKGTVVIRNKTDSAIALSKGTILSSSNNLKFNLDLSVTIASRSADDGTWGKATGTVTAQAVGADGNLASSSDLTVSGYTTDKLVAKSEGNFSGGTSKEVTVVSDADQKKLLAQLTSDLRRQAQQKLQEKLPDKKVLQEALSEEILKRSYSKNINDQASEFSLNLNVRYKGTAFEDKDLRLFVSKLVTTQVPEGFQLDLAETETQADVSKLEKDGKLIFLARFKAKLLPKIDTDKIKNQIKFKTPSEVESILKSTENVLGSEVKLVPSLPKPLQRLPILTNNIKIEVGLK